MSSLTKLPFLALASLILAPLSAQTTKMPPGTVLSYQKISRTAGNFVGGLEPNDQLGRSVTLLGDMDGDGIPDVATGAVSDDDGGEDQGAIWILFLERDGTVKNQQKISALAGNFTGDLDPGDQFGRACGAIGDVDGDGVIDLAVGANFDDDGGGDRGAVWVLFLNADGTVKAQQKISSTEGNFTAELNNFDEFGRSFAPLGDFDGDEIPDLAVGAPYDDDGEPNSGAIYLLFLNRDGTVKSHDKISSTQGGLPFAIGDKDYFGWSLATLDLDLDGTLDIVTGEVLDDAGAINAGSVDVLFMNPDGTVRSAQQISQLKGGFTGELESFDQFGVSLAVVGDLNEDTVPDLAVGAVKYDDGAFETGTIFLLFMNRDGTVQGHHRIGRRGGVDPIPIRANDWFGSSLAPLGDIDLDGTPDVIVGARNDDDGGSNAGALYVLFLESGLFPPAAGFVPSITLGEAPLEVSFQDASNGDITSWMWDFGDGGSSTLEDPTHTYTASGTYTVSLTIAGPGGGDTLTSPGLILVRAPVAGGVTPLGCDLNPAGSLTLMAGEPRIGTTLTFGVDNPLGTQNAGAIARLGVSLAPDPNYPCGTLRTRLGMAQDGTDGEVMIDLTQLQSIETGEVWMGPGQPAAVTLDIAPDTNLIGLKLYVQGLLIDKRATTGPRIAVGGAFEIQIGS